ncbi:MAG: tetratricopeptide repeat protein [Terriglobales bacterium]|jgi:tetratricopeptide (TPR) repeat protein
MKRSARFLVVLAVAASLTGLGCDRLRARDQLNKGVQSYRGAQYDSAIEHFKNAVSLDPTLTVAGLYLATAYAQQCVPGVDTPDNTRNCNQAIDEFKKLLEKNPSDINSLKGIASLYFNMASGASKPEDKLKDLEQAKEYHEKVIQNDPSDPEAYYSVAVIDWTQAYKARMDAKSAAGIKNEDPIKDKKLCTEVQGKNQQPVQEGIDDLNKALTLRKDYDDAMAYLNLLFREKADIECGDPDARKQDLSTADDWVKKTMDTKKAKAEKQQGPGGIVLDQKQGATQ